MTTRPILFSGPMVRRILDEIREPGTGKTQTRRVLKRARVFAPPECPSFSLQGEGLARALQNASAFRHLHGDGWFWEADAYDYQAPTTRTGWMAHIGYAVGDLLWARETWADVNCSDGPALLYRADSALRPWQHWCAELGPDYGAGPSMNYDRYPGDYCMWWSDLLAGSPDHRWRPSNRMPRWASRITLTVTDVRVQRLREISEEDARAEGVEQIGVPNGMYDANGFPIESGSYAAAFAELWDSLNAARGYGWDTNPWVVALTTRPALCNVDEMEKMS